MPPRPSPDGYRGTDGAEDIGRYPALVARRRRPGAAFGPSARQRPLLAHARLVLEPYFQRFAARIVGQHFGYLGRKIFLKTACAAGSAFGL